MLVRPSRPAAPGRRPPPAPRLDVVASSRRAASEALGLALRARAPELALRAGVLADLGTTLARRLGLDEAAVGDVRLTASLADVGALALPDDVLTRVVLDERGRAVRRALPRLGADLLLRTEALGHLAPAVRASRERWDGGGYPDGLAGETIPLAARITATCRRWRRDVQRDVPLAPRRALEALGLEAGRRHDPAVAAELLALLRADV